MRNQAHDLSYPVGGTGGLPENSTVGRRPAERPGGGREGRPLGEKEQGEGESVLVGGAREVNRKGMSLFKRAKEVR